MINIARLAPLIDSLLQGPMHLATTEGDLFDLLHDKVSQNGHCFPVLAIYRELAAAGVLMNGN